MRIYLKAVVSIVVVSLFLCSCSNIKRKPPVITDGFSCTVYAEYEDYSTEFKLKKEGVNVELSYLSPDEIDGLTVNISPAGNLLSFSGLSYNIDDEQISSSLAGCIIGALNYDYTTAEYNGSEYACSLDGNEFEVTLFSDGRISTINFFKLNCLCYFNY